MTAAVSGNRRPLRAALLLIAALAVALAVSLCVQAPSALAATKYVCADSVTVRLTPGGTVRGTMLRNAIWNTITTDGAWTKGTGCWATSAGGTQCGTGWVLSQYLSSSPC